MSKFSVLLDEAKKSFDWQDFVDLLDEFIRESDKRDERIKELEHSNDEWILLDGIRCKDITKLEGKIKELEMQNMELEEGNQNNLKSIENWMGIAAGFKKTTAEYAWRLIWAERE